MPRVSKISTTKTNPINRRMVVGVGAVVAIALVILSAVIFISPLVFGRPNFVVYTTNGEIFVGKASWFPRFNLVDVYIVQTGVPAPEAPGGGLQLVPLKDTPWSPKKIYFEREQVIFYGPINEDSNVANALRSRQ